MPRGRPKGSGTTPAGALERMVYEIGQRLGEALVRGVESSVAKGGGRSAAKAAGVKRGPGRPRAASGGEGCVVPNCSRRAVAKGLCATHYRKARRLNMGDTLSSAQLSELAQDGRKTRFSKAA